MEQVGKIIYNNLKGFVTGRCYPLVAELQTKKPFICYKVNAVRPDATKDNPFTEWIYNVEVTIVSDSYDEVFDICDKSVEKLDKINSEELDLQINEISEDYVEDSYTKSILFTIEI